MALQKRGLGKGLDAFFDSKQDSLVIEEDKNNILEIDITKIEPNRDQPRKHFDETQLNELAVSIKEYGIIQPIIVKKEENYYSIIAGERRWRAARIAKLNTVPVLVKEYDELELLAVSLIENIQRSDLNPIEEAQCYKKLIEAYNYTQEQLADKLGKSRSNITNILRLLKLDMRVQNFIIESKISMGHARSLITIDDGDIQFEMAEKIIEEGLNVRQVEDIIRLFNNKDIKSDEPRLEKNKSDLDVEYKDIEKKLNYIFGTKVNIKNKKNKGKIEIEYFSQEELDRILILFNNIQ